MVAALAADFTRRDEIYTLSLSKLQMSPVKSSSRRRSLNMLYVRLLSLSSGLQSSKDRTFENNIKHATIMRLCREPWSGT